MLEQQVHKISEHRDKLQEAVRLHESHGPSYISKVPFSFFEDLHREHSRILSLLTQKIDQAESLAKEIFSNLSSGQLSQDQATPLKQKIFYICKGIYDQQKLISAELYKIDQKVRDLKRETTTLLLKKNPGMTVDEVEKIFQRNENREVGKTLEAANDKY